jgi:hypothetical protein
MDHLIWKKEVIHPSILCRDCPKNASLVEALKNPALTSRNSVIRSERAEFDSGTSSSEKVVMSLSLPLSDSSSSQIFTAHSY